MGNNGLIDPKPGFSQAYCFSGSQMPCCRSSCLQNSELLQLQCIYLGTGFIDSRAARARLLLEVAHPRSVQALFSSQCLRQPAVQAPPQPANSDGTCVREAQALVKAQL